MLRFTLSFRELAATFSCVSTMAAVHGTQELVDLSGELAAILQAVSDQLVVEIDVELGRGDS